jgi:hypothetical protein
MQTCGRSGPTADRDRFIGFGLLKTTYVERRPQADQVKLRQYFALPQNLPLPQSPGSGTIDSRSDSVPNRRNGVGSDAFVLL